MKEYIIIFLSGIAILSIALIGIVWAWCIIKKQRRRKKQDEPKDEEALQKDSRSNFEHIPPSYQLNVPKQEKEDGNDQIQRYNSYGSFGSAGNRQLLRSSSPKGDSPSLSLDDNGKQLGSFKANSTPHGIGDVGSKVYRCWHLRNIRSISAERLPKPVNRREKSLRSSKSNSAGALNDSDFISRSDAEESVAKQLRDDREDFERSFKLREDAWFGGDRVVTLTEERSIDAIKQN